MSRLRWDGADARGAVAATTPPDLDRAIRKSFGVIKDGLADYLGETRSHGSPPRHRSGHVGRGSETRLRGDPRRSARQGRRPFEGLADQSRLRRTGAGARRLLPLWLV